jgi:hypothetical protein
LFVIYYYKERKFQRRQFTRMLDQQKNCLMRDPYELGYHQDQQSRGGVFVQGVPASLSGSGSSDEQEMGKWWSPTRTMMHPAAVPQESALMPVHPAYIPVPRVPQTTDDMLSPTSAGTFYSYRETATTPARSLASFRTTSPAFPIGKHRKKKGKSNRMRPRGDGEAATDPDDDELQSAMTRPAAPIGRRGKKGSQELPLRMQLAMSSRNQAETSLQEVELPARKEMPLASGKSLLYGW